MTVVPLLADEVQIESSDGFQSRTSPRTAAGWDTRVKTSKVVAELLEPFKTKVSSVDDVTSLLGSSDDAQGWPQQVWQRLRATNRLGDTGAVLILRQNAVDAMGRQYSPAADFLSTGLIGLAVGAATRDDRFHPSFVLAINAGFHAAMIGGSHCSIGFDARLLDAKSGSLLSQTSAVLGQERLPDTFHAQDWETMSEGDRRIAETYCIAALRRALSQAINELNLVAQ